MYCIMYEVCLYIQYAYVTCVFVFVRVCILGVPCRISGFQGDSMLQLRQRSFPGKVLQLEAIQRG